MSVVKLDKRKPPQNLQTVPRRSCKKQSVLDSFCVEKFELKTGESEALLEEGTTVGEYSTVEMPQEQNKANSLMNIERAEDRPYGRGRNL